MRPPTGTGVRSTWQVPCPVSQGTRTGGVGVGVTGGGVAVAVAAGEAVAVGVTVERAVAVAVAEASPSAWPSPWAWPSLRRGQRTDHDRTVEADRHAGRRVRAAYAGER